MQSSGGDGQAGNPTASATQLPEQEPGPGPGSSAAIQPPAPESSPVDKEPPAPLREDFVQNAVKFLSHPKVKGSPVQYRRSFLEKKGLTAAEIDEAFTRVPDSRAESTASTVAPSPPASQQRVVTGAAPAGLGSGSALPTMYAQPQQFYQTPSGQVVALQQAPLATEQPQQLPLVAQPKPRMRWTQMVIALGVLSAAGAGTAVLTKNYLLPHLKALLQRWLFSSSPEGKPSPLEEATSAAAGAASAAANAAALIEKGRTEDREKFDALLSALQSQTAEVKTALGTVKEAVDILDASRKEAVILGGSTQAGRDASGSSVSIADLRKELRSFANVITEFSNPQPFPALPTKEDIAKLRVELSEMKSLLGKPATGSLLQQNGTSSSYLATQDGPSSPGKPARRWGTTSSTPIPEGDQLTASNSLPAVRPTSSGGSDARREVAPPARPMTAPPSEAPHPNSYAEVLRMVQEGKTPPNVRKIDDRPPNPDQQPSSAKLQPRPKPWERPQSEGYNPATSAGRCGYTADNPAPWWRPAPSSGPASSQSGAAGSSAESALGTGASGQADGAQESSQQGWRPPPAPGLAMPSAAAAIAGKPAKQSNNNDQGTGDSGRFKEIDGDQRQNQSDSMGQKGSREVPEEAHIEDGAEA